MTDSNTIFLLDDDKDLCDQLHSLLTQISTVQYFTDPEDLLMAIKKGLPDLVIVDLNLNHARYDGFSVISHLKERPDSHLCSLLMLSGADSSDILKKAYRSGIEDYIPKPIIPQIFISKIENILYNSRKKIHTNALTGLPGIVLIEKEIESRMQDDAPFSVGYLDLDNFKPFNDERGVKAGDEGIKLVAGILNNVRKNFNRDELFIGHLGGDDFFLVGERESLIQAIADAYRHFEHGCRKFFKQPELQNGYYHGTSRGGEKQKIKLLTISTAVLHIESGQKYSFDELSEEGARDKKAAKDVDGNSVSEKTF